MNIWLAGSRANDRVNEFVGKSVIWLILLAVLVRATLVRAVNALSCKLFNASRRMRISFHGR